MFIQRKIDRYVEAAAKYLPLKYRSRAKQELSAEIMDLVEALSDEREPDILEVREVLKGMGKPEEAAKRWLTEAKRASASGNRDFSSYSFLELISFDFISLEKLHAMLQSVMFIFTVLAAALVIFGIVALGTNAIHTMLPIFLGCVLALGVVAGRGVLGFKYRF